jgi:hypothetical protein
VRSHRGVELHRRSRIPPEHVDEIDSIPVSSVPLTLVDLGNGYEQNALEAMINAADRHDRCDPEQLRSALEAFRGYPGVQPLRRTLDHRTFSLTDSELERRFLLIARSVGLPKPQTQARLNGFRVDFLLAGCTRAPASYRFASPTGRSVSSLTA